MSPYQINSQDRWPLLTPSGQPDAKANDLGSAQAWPISPFFLREAVWREKKYGKERVNSNRAGSYIYTKGHIFPIPASANQAYALGSMRKSIENA
jgi:hypothetical protein